MRGRSLFTRLIIIREDAQRCIYDAGMLIMLTAKKKSPAVSFFTAVHAPKDLNSTCGDLWDHPEEDFDHDLKKKEGKKTTSELYYSTSMLTFPPEGEIPGYSSQLQSSVMYYTWV